MSTSFVGGITHIPFMNASTTGMCVLQTTNEVDIGGHYNSTLEQGQCFVLTLLTLPQTAPERMSNVGHSRAAIGQSEGRCPLTCTGHPPCRTPPRVSQRNVKIQGLSCFNVKDGGIRAIISVGIMMSWLYLIWNVKITQTFCPSICIHYTIMEPDRTTSVLAG